MRLAFGFAFVAVAASATTRAPGGECFWVRGRLSAANGNPTFRIWPIGTHRMLGVLGHQAMGTSLTFLPMCETYSRRLNGISGAVFTSALRQPTNLDGCGSSQS
jgi:hypothetical protein